MASPLFEERPIAVIWDFDKTLIPGSMQWPLFEKFKVDQDLFWDEANGLAGFYREQGLELVSEDTLYLTHILSYVRAGRFKGLTNDLLKSLGEKLEFYPGLPDFFSHAKSSVADNPLFRELRIVVEHYIVSTGLRQMILGSAIADHVYGIWASEFVEHQAPPGYLTEPREARRPSEIQDIGYTIDNTTKTCAVFEINKGVNLNPKIDVNARIRPEDRRVPFQNMIYIADGPSDVPVFSILQQYGGKTYAVFAEGSGAEFDQVHTLLEDGRVDSVGEANYELGKPAAMWILRAIANTADRMAASHRAELEAEFAARVGAAPKHLEKE